MKGFLVFLKRRRLLTSPPKARSVHSRLITSPAVRLVSERALVATRAHDKRGRAPGKNPGSLLSVCMLNSIDICNIAQLDLIKLWMLTMSSMEYGK